MKRARKRETERGKEGDSDTDSLTIVLYSHRLAEQSQQPDSINPAKLSPPPHAFPHSLDASLLRSQQKDNFLYYIIFLPTDK